MGAAAGAAVDVVEAEAAVVDGVVSEEGGNVVSRFSSLNYFA